MMRAWHSIHTPVPSLSFFILRQDDLTSTRSPPDKHILLRLGSWEWSFKLVCRYLLPGGGLNHQDFELFGRRKKEDDISVFCVL